MEDREEYLILFLRGCAQAADEGKLGVEHQRLMVNGDLMREAADRFEKTLPPKFKSFADELAYYLQQAEQYARKAHDLLYTGGQTRSIWFKMAAGRAQSILMSLYTQEIRRKN